MIDIESLTLKQINELKSLFIKDTACHKNPYKIGEKYLIRTVTHYYTGKLINIYDRELELSDAAWIPDTGRYSICLEKGELTEVEPIPTTAIINRDSIIDCVIWQHELPRKMK